MGTCTLPHGRFVTLEGPDGSGKSTQAAWLSEALNGLGWSVVLAREPGGTAVGERIRSILLESRDAQLDPWTDALLFNAARAQNVREVITPALARGSLVVCDRFADSTLAYQGYGSGLDLGTLRRLESVTVAGCRPDLTLLLDLPVEVGLARRSSGPPDGWTRFEAGRAFDRAFHERVRAAFLELAASEPERWRILDASAPADVLAGQLRGLVTGALASWDSGATPPG
jgi:dTMP kinase